MRVCPRCQGRYDDESRFCPRDGASLPSSEADPRLGTVLAGQFELLEVCGRGAMGTVYRAWQSGMDREVAVKILRTDYVKDPAVVKRFHREARSVARLHHPNIVTVFMVGETDDHVPFMVMEYVDGEPLSSELARGEALPVGRALRIARQIASALAEAHGAGIIHRDLKPANILLEQRRRAADVVKVVDFGIAKIIGGGAGAAGANVSALTHTGTIFGTPHYLSPEQAQGATVDGRADLYSLGVILYTMVTGRVPYDGSGMAVVVQHVNGTPARPGTLTPGLPASVEALVMRLMEKDPAARPQTAEDVSDAIDGLLASLGEAGAPLARAESQPSSPVPLPREPGPASAVAPAAVPGVTIKATALAPPSGSAPPAMTVKGAALLAPARHPLDAAPIPSRSTGAPPMVTVKAGAISPSQMNVQPADATVPPPSRAMAAAPEPRLSAETAYAMPQSGLAAVQIAARPMSAAIRAPSAMAAAAPVPPPISMPMPVPPAPRAQPSMADESEAWRPPSPWRRVLLVVLALVFCGGAAVAGVYALKRNSTRTELPGPTPPSGKPASASASDGKAAHVANAATPATTPAPKLGDLPDASVETTATGEPVGPADAPVPVSDRVITLGEAGWAVRVLLPSTIVAGADIDLAVEAWDPSGHPVDAHELRLSVHEPNGLERSLTLPAVEQVGRFQVRRRFASAGRYELRIFPAAGKTKPVVWFALQVEDPSRVGMLTVPEPVRKPVPVVAHAKKVGDGSSAAKKPAGVDPYHLLDESGGGKSATRPAEKPADKPVEKPVDKPDPAPPAPHPSKNGPPPAPPPAPKKQPTPPVNGEVELE